MKTRRVPVGGVTLRVLEAGPDDGRPLLLVHGYTGAKEDFADHLDRLGDLGWHAVAPDLRGHGESDQPAGEDAYSLRIFTADVLGLANALGWERFVLLGHSMGGMIAQLVALEEPTSVAALVLMDTSHGPPEGIEPELVELGKAVVREGGMRHYLDVTREMEGPLDTPAYLRLLETRAGYREFCEGKTLASSADMWVAMVDELLAQPDRLDALRSLTIPALVIAGEQDTPFLGPAKAMADAIPGARLVVIPDAGHSPQFENPDAWWDALTGFLAEVEAGFGVNN